MTTELKPQDVFRSKKNFEEFMKNEYPVTILSTLADYPKTDGKGIVTIADLTQDGNTLYNALVESDKLSQAPFIVWIVANEKEIPMKATEVLNRFSAGRKGFGVFIFKAELIDNKIKFKCLLKPDLEQFKKASTGGDAKQIQLDYWNKYFEICDEIGSDMQVNPKPQHWQYIAMGKRGVSLQLTVNTQTPYIAVDLVINNDKTIYENLLDKQEEIEETLGKLEWHSLENNKSSKIRKYLNIDFKNPEIIENAIKTHIKMAEDFKTTFAKYL